MCKNKHILQKKNVSNFVEIDINNDLLKMFYSNKNSIKESII
jgi:hypothetical protein